MLQFLIEYNFNANEFWQTDYQSNYNPTKVKEIPVIESRTHVYANDLNLGINLLNERVHYRFKLFLFSNLDLLNASNIRLVFFNFLGAKKNLTNNKLVRGDPHILRFPTSIWDFCDIFKPETKIVIDVVKGNNEVLRNLNLNYYENLKDYLYALKQMTNKNQRILLFICNHNLTIDSSLHQLLAMAYKVFSINYLDLIKTNPQLYTYFKGFKVHKYLYSAIIHEHIDYDGNGTKVDSSHIAIIKQLIYLIRYLLIPYNEVNTEYLACRLLLNYYLIDKKIGIENEHLKYCIYNHITLFGSTILENFKAVLFKYEYNKNMTIEVIRNDYVTAKINTLTYSRPFYNNRADKPSKNNTKQDQNLIKKYFNNRFGFIPNSSFIKLMSILVDMQLDLSDEKHTNLHLCEAPGYWIKCVKLYRQLRYTGKQYNNWIAITLPEGFQVLPDFPANKWILEDITKIDINRLPFSKFITSDLGIDNVQYHPEDKLIAANQAVCNVIDKRLLPEGNAIIKYFLPAINQNTIDMLHKLSMQFEDIIYYKPNTNSQSYEFYIIFKNKSSKTSSLTYNDFLSSHLSIVKELIDRANLNSFLFDHQNLEMRSKEMFNMYKALTLDKVRI